MKVLLTGRGGQVGWELERTLAGDIVALDRERLDLASPSAIAEAIRTAKPDVIVNAAAYTAVDLAESEPHKARAINAEAPGVMAEAARRLGALLVHYSTDYVFDGSKAGPYAEDDSPNPLGVYGRTKLEGERAIQESGCRHLILRTCWVYGARGRNFLLTMLRLAAERPELRVVDDQVGSPTWSRAISRATVELLARGVENELVHVACEGYASWFRFADEIVRRTPERRPAQPAVVPIASSDYPTPARRPLNSRLSTAKLAGLLGHGQPPWQDSLAECLAGLGR
jgi:dTDP-4-dehydrorhamnose reductase